MQGRVWGRSANSRCRSDLRCCHRQESREGPGALGAQVGRADPAWGKRKPGQSTLASDTVQNSRCGQEQF